MATTYQSDHATSAVPVRTPVPGGTATVLAAATITGAIVVNDVFEMVKVPKGAFVLDAWVVMPDVDTDGTPAATFILGDGGDDNRYITQTAAGTAAALVRMNAVTAGVATSVYTTDDTVDIKFDTAPDASVTTGTIYCCVTYAMQD